MYTQKIYQAKISQTISTVQLLTENEYSKISQRKYDIITNRASTENVSGHKYNIISERITDHDITKSQNRKLMLKYHRLELPQSARTKSCRSLVTLRGSCHKQHYFSLHVPYYSSLSICAVGRTA
jgi:hypothetical protein